MTEIGIKSPLVQLQVKAVSLVFIFIIPTQVLNLISLYLYIFICV